MVLGMVGQRKKWNLVSMNISHEKQNEVTDLLPTAKQTDNASWVVRPGLGMGECEEKGRGIKRWIRRKRQTK